jgi:hypothetical protein
MPEPPESLKFFANRLAQTAGRSDAGELLRRLRLFETGGKRSNRTQAVAAPDRVGIWERKKNSPFFTRAVDRFDEWHLWAGTGRIEPKKQLKRVVLIGESVARGYLYDPQFTGAKALSLILESQIGAQKIEVVDLARTNLGFTNDRGAIIDLLRSALLLEPDCVVVFAGNNWGGDLYSTIDISEMRTAAVNDLPHFEGSLCQEGVSGLKRFVETRIAEQIRNLFEQVVPVYQQRRVPILWVIPEFNLRDWRDPLTSAPYLLNGSNCDWIKCLEAAQHALVEHDYRSAATLAQKMIDLDRGVCATGFQILADCSKATGDLKAERQYLESARDASLWDFSMDRSPRTLGITRRTLLEQSAKYKTGVVDLATIFSEHLKGEIPDRRLFLDYCHLTAEGLQVAFAAVASWVLRSLSSRDVSWRQMLNVSVAPSDKIQGEGAFLAALHNGHYDQGYGLVHHYCREALRLCPQLEQVMIAFIDAQTGHTPLLLSRSAEKIAELDFPSIQYYLFRHIKDQHFDGTVIDAIVAALETAGISYGTTLAQLRQQRNLGSKLDVLSNYYCTSSLHPLERNWNVPGLLSHRYYKAYWHCSKFLFVATLNRSLRLRITCRVGRSSSTDDPIVITVNGAGGYIEATHTWTGWEIAVPAGSVQDGINEIQIHWPTPEFRAQPALEDAIAAMLRGVKPEFYCTFGEIQAFTIAEEASSPVDSIQITREETLTTGCR